MPEDIKEEKAKLIPQNEVKKEDEKGIPPEAETLEVPLGSEIEPVKLPEIKPVDKTKTSNIEDDLGVHLTKTQVTDLTDGGASTLHKHAINIVDDITPQLGGDLDLNGRAIDFPSTPNIIDCHDEDDMATADALGLATQQSIKAYVDSKIAGTKLHIFTTDVDISTTNETTILTVSVPANTLGTNNGIRGKIYIDDLDNTNTAVLKIRLKYGGTTLCLAQTPALGTADDYDGYIDFLLLGAGATNAQEASVFVGLNVVGIVQPFQGQQSGTATEDSTGALNLVITAERTGAGTISIAHGYAEIIK